MRKPLLVVVLSLIAATAFSQGMPRDAVILGERTVDFHGKITTSYPSVTTRAFSNP